MDVHEIRITSHGKMKGWIAFALDNLQKEGSKPIVLHTLPVPNPKPTTAPSASTRAYSTALIPRLISVVEIIKREYLKTLQLQHSTRLLGLYQYNEVGSLESIGLTSGQGDVSKESDQRAQELINALEGKNLKHVQTPYMRITLSLCELPELKDKGATYQPPAKRRISKSAKARAKKREKQPNASTNSGETTDSLVMEHV